MCALYVFACVCACVFVCARACVCVCACVWLVFVRPWTYQLLDFCLQKSRPEAAPAPQNEEQMLRVAKSCLKTMSVYIPWIDVKFSASPKFLGLVAQ